MTQGHSKGVYPEDRAHRRPYFRLLRLHDSLMGTLELDMHGAFAFLSCNELSPGIWRTFASAAESTSGGLPGGNLRTILVRKVERVVSASEEAYELLYRFGITNSRGTCYPKNFGVFMTKP